MFFSALCGIALAASAAWAAPAVTTLSPANGALGVHPLAQVSITFDSAVEAGQARLLELRRKSDGHVLSAVAAASSFVSIEGAAAVIAFPSRQVVSGAVYVTVEAGAFVSKTDQSAFAGVADRSWWFELQGLGQSGLHETRLALRALSLAAFAAGLGCASMMRGQDEPQAQSGLHSVNISQSEQATTYCDMRFD
ncbi:unnamed protein product, partial [Symbiodinium sp. KB8]